MRQWSPPNSGPLARVAAGVGVGKGAETGGDHRPVRPSVATTTGPAGGWGLGHAAVEWLWQRVGEGYALYQGLYPFHGPLGFRLSVPVSHGI